MKNYLLPLLFLIMVSGCRNAPQNPHVIIATDHGEIELELYTSKAPVTADHFLKNVDEGRYERACFYRTVRTDNQPHNKIKIEVIQGGLFHDEIVDAQPTIEHETTKQTGINHTNGVISMARLEPGTASTEFFICVGDQPSLDYGGMRNPDGQGFAAFGKVVKGMDVVRQIQQQKDQGQYLVEKVRILSLRRN